MLFRIILNLLLLHYVVSLNAQNDSIAFTSKFDSFVEVKSSRFDEGISSLKFSYLTMHNYKGQSVSDLLQKEAGIYIKQYGSGLLATATHRGGSAAQTAILWEGLNILNPMLGQSDLSLLPVFFADRAEWQSGGNSAMIGNNATGGNLQLFSDTDYNKGWNRQGFFQIGSFGEQKKQLSIRYSNNKFAGSLRIFHQNADNDYTFTDVNAFGNPKPKKQLTHAYTESFGILTENKFRLVKDLEFSIKNWFQMAYRQIPPTLLQSTGDNEIQKDQVFRNMLSWKKTGIKSIWKWDIAYIREHLNYSSLVINSNSTTDNIFAKIESVFELEPWQFLKVGTEYQFQQANSDAYKNGQNLFAFYFNYKLNFKNWKLNFSLREQIVDKTFLLPAVGINSLVKISENPWRKIYFQTSISHNYRFPTLNDRFWPVGGNPSLKPEYSWSSDCKFSIELFPGNDFIIKIEPAAYLNYTDNWIQWTPSDNNGIWSPQNISKVLAYGPEFYGKIEKKISDNYFELSLRYQLNSARRMAESDPLLQNKQLIYTPEHSISGNFEWNFKDKLILRYFHNFFSERYIDNSNTNLLAAYQIGSFQLEYRIKINTLNIYLKTTIDNCWNVDYQTIANRPMPGRSFNFSITIQ
jgi:vitamin B12 transporter